MVRKLMRTIAVAALITGLTGGVAHATEGWYGRGDVGYSVDGSLDIDGADEIGFDDDWYEGLGLGYAFPGGFRIEGEIGHRFNQLETSEVVTDGDVHAWSAMVNGYYDFQIGDFEPYVGLGVGAAKLNANATAPNDQFDADDTVAAYQALLGVALPVSDRLALDIGYRYFIAPDAEFDGLQDGVVPTTYSADYEHQAISVGLRWQFAAAAPPPAPPPPPPPAYTPPPPPPPPPPACPTSEFTVYFEWDRSNLNAEALQVIDQAVARAQQCNISSAVVVGHTDTSGSTQYNVGLSERRASVVRDALVARGMPAASINTQARGETDLARPTRDGVREPLNRRTAVTITFR